MPETQSFTCVTEFAGLEPALALAAAAGPEAFPPAAEPPCHAGQDAAAGPPAEADAAGEAALASPPPPLAAAPLGEASEGKDGGAAGDGAFDVVGRMGGP